jgi:hypothetical protein
MTTPAKVDNPSQRGDYVIQHFTKRDYCINPYRSFTYTVTRVGIVRTLRRNGTPSRVEWLAGQYDHQKRDASFACCIGSGDAYKTVAASLLRADVTIDDIENATKGRTFANWDEIKAAFRPFLKSAQVAA